MLTDLSLAQAAANSINLSTAIGSLALSMYKEFISKGNGSLDYSAIIKLIDKSSELIKKNGNLILEIGHNQKNKVSNMLKKRGFYIFKTLKDYAKNDRCIISTKL